MTCTGALPCRTMMLFSSNCRRFFRFFLVPKNRPRSRLLQQSTPRSLNLHGSSASGIWRSSIDPQVGCGDRHSDVALFFSQKSGHPLAEFLLLVQITVQNRVDASSRDVGLSANSLHVCRRSLANSNSTFWTISGFEASEAFVVFHALGRVETTSERFAQRERCS